MPEKVAVLSPHGIPTGGKANWRRSPCPCPDISGKTSVDASGPGQLCFILIDPKIDDLAQGRHTAIGAPCVAEVTVDDAYLRQRPSNLGLDCNAIRLTLKAEVIFTKVSELEGNLHSAPLKGKKKSQCRFS
jgi:hypothetical protein